MDKGGCLKEVERGNSSAASFMASADACICVDERICEKDHKLYKEGLSSRIKLSLYI